MDLYELTKNVDSQDKNKVTSDLTRLIDILKKEVGSYGTTEHKRRDGSISYTYYSAERIDGMLKGAIGKSFGLLYETVMPYHTEIIANYQAKKQAIELINNNLISSLKRTKTTSAMGLGYSITKDVSELKPAGIRKFGSSRLVDATIESTNTETGVQYKLNATLKTSFGGGKKSYLFRNETSQGQAWQYLVSKVINDLGNSSIGQ